MEIISFREAGRRLGVRVDTIGDIVRVLGIEPVPHPSNGSAKGLDVEAMSRIRMALNPEAHRRLVAQSA